MSLILAVGLASCSLLYEQQSQAIDASATGDAEVVDAPAPGCGAPSANVGEFFEAEAFSGRSDDGCFSWAQESTVAGFQGSGYLRAVPITQVCGTSACLEDVSLDECGAAVWWSFNVSVAGRYYLHARGLADDNGDDSIYYGADDEPATFELDAGAAERSDMRIGCTDWAWVVSPFSMDLEQGCHTLHIWMRENGARIDQILLDESPTAMSDEMPCPPG